MKPLTERLEKTVVTGDDRRACVKKAKERCYGWAGDLIYLPILAPYGRCHTFCPDMLGFTIETYRECEDYASQGLPPFVSLRQATCNHQRDEGSSACGRTNGRRGLDGGPAANSTSAVRGAR